MKYDARAKKIIAKDWEREFPGFTVWKPTRLIRRYGPLLVEVCLESGSDPKVYNPIAHIHNLCELFPVITLSLAGNVLNDKGLPIYIKAKNHNDTYIQLVEKIKSDYPYTNKNVISFNDLTLATQKYIAGRTIPFQHTPYNNIVTTAAYVGQINYAKEALNNFAAIISEWSERAFNIIGSVEKWRSGLLELIENIDKLRQNVEQELIKHKLTEIADNGLLWPEKVIKLWEMPCKPMYGAESK